MKKIYFLCVCLLVFAGAAYGQEDKYYYNYEKGWTGKIKITYIGIADNNKWNILQSDSEKFSSISGFRSSPVEKLSEKDWWLVWEALREYRISNNEVYLLMIYEGYSALFVYVRIQNNGQSADWFARRGYTK